MMPLQAKKKKVIIIAISLLTVTAVIATVFLADRILHKGVGYAPEYGKVDLSYLLDVTELSEEDYKTVFYQTGLGRVALDELFGKSDFLQKLKGYQDDFFSPDNVICKREAITTCMEYASDGNGNKQKCFDFAPMKPGYVLIMESSHSFFWRHGHAGLAVSGNSVLEALMIGTDSGIYSIESWKYYPSFVMLKPKDLTEAQMYSVAKSASISLRDVKYSPFAFKSEDKGTNSTQCAHLVWKAFADCGYDIDEGGDFIVTVQNILYSDKFEVVQIYGYSPDIFADRAF